MNPEWFIPDTAMTFKGSDPTPTGTYYFNHIPLEFVKNYFWFDMDYFLFFFKQEVGTHIYILVVKIP